MILPATLTINTGNSDKVKSVALLGVKQKLKWKQEGGSINITIPESLQNNNGLQYAATIKIIH
jgi:alpha-L-fucosidase